MTFPESLKRRISAESQRPRLSVDELQELRGEYPGLPEDYLLFLQEIGYGDIGEIQIYSAPVNPRQIYQGQTTPLSSVVLIGDDFQGFSFGFDMADNFRLVEVTPRGELDTTIEPSFREFLEAIFEDV